MTPTEVYKQERPRLFGLAYRMLGTVADADDVLQEAWLRWDRVSHDDIVSPPAYLTTITTRLAIDRLRSAQREREVYVGPWLPEPILTDHDPAHVIELDETVTLTFLAVLERLKPLERAVFLLHDVFGLPFAEIATITERTDANCRQLARRAREHVQSERARFAVDAERRDELTNAFETALLAGDIAGLQQVLVEDVVHYSDGGADVHAARRPVVGRERVSRFLINLAERRPDDMVVAKVEANGEPAYLASIGGVPLILLTLDIGTAGIRRINGVVNPEKLRAAREAIDQRMME